MINYSVVIPVYNGEHTIAILFDKLRSFFTSRNYSFEVVFVYDCGPDKSWSVIKQLKSNYPNLIKAVRLSRNFGQHNALICGFKHATGNFIITMDEDLQHDPDDIIKLIHKQEETDSDVVYGKYDLLKHSSFRNITSTMLKKLLNIGIPFCIGNLSFVYFLMKTVLHSGNG